jgi:hypothetical protein
LAVVVALPVVLPLAVTVAVALAVALGLTAAVALALNRGSCGGAAGRGKLLRFSLSLGRAGRQLGERLAAGWEKKASFSQWRMAAVA